MSCDSTEMLMVINSMEINCRNDYSFPWIYSIHYRKAFLVYHDLSSSK